MENHSDNCHITHLHYTYIHALSMTFGLCISHAEGREFKIHTPCALQKSDYPLFFLLPLLLANYDDFFYDLGLFILAGSISELYLHAMTAVLMGASLCSAFFTSINSKNDASPWVKSIS